MKGLLHEENTGDMPRIFFIFYFCFLFCFPSPGTEVVPGLGDTDSKISVQMRGQSSSLGGHLHTMHVDFVLEAIIDDSKN